MRFEVFYFKLLVCEIIFKVHDLTHQFFFNFVHEMGTGPPLLLPSDKISPYTNINCDPYPVESI